MGRQIQIGNRTVGDGSPVMIVAEIGVNHNGDETLARSLIDGASAAGADAVKFQAFVPEALCSAIHRQKELEMLRRCVMSQDAMLRLRDHATGKGMIFLCTPFDFESLEFVVKMGCPAIKIGSGEMTHTPFLSAAGRYGLPVILSTGAAARADLVRAVAALTGSAVLPVALLHCVSSYPARDDCMNLLAIRTLAAEFTFYPIGLSDHSEGTVAAVLSIALGAAIIEKHVTLDRNLEGPDHKASATLAEFADLVANTRRAEKMLGDGVKKVEKCESTIGHSITAACNLAAGTILAEQHLAYKRPGTGLRPYMKDTILGRRLKRSVAADELIFLDMLL